MKPRNPQLFRQGGRRAVKIHIRFAETVPQNLNLGEGHLAKARAENLGYRFLDSKIPR